uniref:CASP-like protein 0U2 n=1 Tax=Chlorokybus atmophyticus TaxID=3144 RepID=CSPL2_CHLAT|nr:RecName: Full=CASP-like protein 0U2; Short=CaCASPL0U2 [Chlorokybus atmophyticus]
MPVFGLAALKLNWEALSTPKFRVTFAQWVCSLLMWSLMASYSKHGEFKFVVVFGLVMWGLASTYLVYQLLNGPPLAPIVEFWANVAAGSLAFICLVLASATCNRAVGEPQTKVCSGELKPKASAAFAFLLLCAYGGLAYLSWRTWRNPPTIASYALHDDPEFAQPLHSSHK